MLKNLSSTQMIVGAIIAVAGVVGWVLFYNQIEETNSLKQELEPARQDLASANNELEKLNSQIPKLEQDLASAQNNRDQLQKQVEASKSLEELTEALEAGNSQMQTLNSQIEESKAALAKENSQLQSVQSDSEEAKAELDDLRARVRRQQALLEGKMPRFKTTTRTRVRVGPSTDTEEVGVIPAGRTVQVFEIVEDGKWYKVGGMGYIFHDLLQPVEKERNE